ncbi:hypothetical protein GQX73_g2712 [Xylaria multiplex]|uniref:Uncharacterized protein n=1 Tax=Xylaria multiplex TaxID=323545 RepID=A0A7C8MXJ7_9PEZI|nr:hypothetical protein GQX73_g2712 [Xylaria multiplex]
MKINGIALFSTLALSACLSRAAVENGAVAAVDQGDAANVAIQVQGDVAGNNSSVADGADAVDENENENGNENENENENQDNEDTAEENAGQDNNLDLGQILNGTLGNGFDDINIDPNNIQGSLGQNILDLLLSMGICNFNLNSLNGLSLGNEIQLLLQLQQLQQLQALGIINSFTVDQLIQREILSRTFNLNIIKRSIDASVKQASRGMKRTVMLKRQCANVGQSQGNANNGAGQDQVDQDQVDQDEENQNEENQGEAKENNNAEQENEDEVEAE